MNLLWPLVVILIVLAVLGVPTGYVGARLGGGGYGYWPSGLIGVIVLLIVLRVLGII